ncbi:hypothetical protein D3C83_238080 [compost metagenome]
MRVARNAIPLLMDPSSLRLATTKCPLSPEQVAAISRDLALHPSEPLTEVLQAILDLNFWVEQETLLQRLESTL